MNTVAKCDLCVNPPPFMCNECAGRDMTPEGQEIIAAMHHSAPMVQSIIVPQSVRAVPVRRSIVGAAVPADFMYV